MAAGVQEKITASATTTAVNSGPTVTIRTPTPEPAYIFADVTQTMAARWTLLKRNGSAKAANAGVGFMDSVITQQVGQDLNNINALRTK